VVKVSLNNVSRGSWHNSQSIRRKDSPRATG